MQQLAEIFLIGEVSHAYRLPKNKYLYYTLNKLIIFNGSDQILCFLNKGAVVAPENNEGESAFFI